MLYVCKALGLIKVCPHSSAAISIPILQMRQTKAWKILSDLCKIIHLIHGRGRIWTLVSLNLGYCPQKRSPNPHIQKRAAPHSSSWLYPRSQMKVREVGQRDTEEDQTTEMHAGACKIKWEFWTSVELFKYFCHLWKITHDLHSF